MKNKKLQFLQFPEYYLLVLTILGGYTPPFSFHPIFIGILGLLVVQLIFKNKIVGTILGSLFLLINLYMLGALISELREFTAFNTAAKNLAFVGFTLWGLNMLAALTMIYKYAIIPIKRKPQGTTMENIS